MNAIDIDSPESWSIARRYASLLNPIPSSVCDCISALWNCHSSAPKGTEPTLTEREFDRTRRMDKAAKLKTPLFFAAQALVPERFTDISEDDASKALLKILGPGLFASLLGLIYMHRRLNKICTDPAWENFSKEFVLNMELGYLFGLALPAIGSADGVLLGGIRFAALASLFVHSPENYIRYRNVKKQNLDIEEEHRRWGCDHAQISSFLIKDLGFRSDVVETVQAIRKVDPERYPMPQELQVWGALLAWLDSSKQNKGVTADPKPMKTLNATDSDVQTLQGKITGLLEKGSTFEWMFRSKE